MGASSQNPVAWSREPGVGTPEPWELGARSREPWDLGARSWEPWKPGALEAGSQEPEPWELGARSFGSWEPIPLVAGNKKPRELGALGAGSIRSWVSGALGARVKSQELGAQSQEPWKLEAGVKSLRSWEPRALGAGKHELGNRSQEL